jgi:hypothetical protein
MGMSITVYAERQRRFAVLTALLALVGVLAGEPGVAPVGHLPPRVAVERLPQGHLQPSVVSAAGGELQMVCLAGDAKGSDVVWLRRAPGAQHFGDPVKVNSVPGSAVAVGSIRGPVAALGGDGMLHVLWNGSQSAQKRFGGGGPLLYTRSVAGGTFEAERDLMGETHELDGGSGVAVSAEGRVSVFWHAGPDAKSGEPGRGVFLRTSTDGGASFDEPLEMLRDRKGVCACCALGGAYDNDGALWVLYRGAPTPKERGLVLTLVPAGGEPRVRAIDDWSIATCPMSSVGLARTKEGLFVAWENAGQVFLARMSPMSSPGKTVSPAGEAGTRKHPRIAVNDAGEVLMVWTERTAWNKGGSVAWQVFDAAGEPIAGSAGTAEGLPVWGFAAAAALADGSFVVVY